VAGQGFEVWDGATRKVLIGRLDDNSIGQEIVGGKLYSSYIRSGSKTDTSYIELGAGFEPLLVKENGKTALTIWAYDGGLMQWYDTVLNDMVGQILPTEAFFGSGGLKIHARNNTGTTKNVAIVGDTIYLDPVTEVNVLGDLHVGGDFSVSGSGKGCIVETIDYGKRWQYAVEGPEIRLEDKGCGVLVDGQCRIELKPKFLQTIEKDLPEAPWVIDATPYFKGSLGVTEIGENYFVVNDCDDIPSNGRFSWSLSGVKIGCIGIYMPEFQPEGDILTSNWEDVLPTIDLLTIDTEVLTSNWEDELWKSTT